MEESPKGGVPKNIKHKGMAPKDTQKNGFFHPFAVTLIHDQIVLLYGIAHLKGIDLFLSASDDGITFPIGIAIDITREDGAKESLLGCESFSIFVYKQTTYVSFVRKMKSVSRRVMAQSEDGVHFRVTVPHADMPAGVFAMVSDYTYKKSFVAYGGETTLCVSASPDFSEWHTSCDLVTPRQGYFDAESIRVVSTVMVDKGILVVYSVKSISQRKTKTSLGAVLFDKEKPYEIVWRTPEPLWEEEANTKTSSEYFLGSVRIGHTLHVYRSTAQGDISSTTIDLSPYGLLFIKDARQLKRYHQNPIITPASGNDWENEATFNPAALHLDGKFHLLYRAIGDGGISVFGYASSHNGLTIHERLHQPAFTLKDPLPKKNPLHRVSLPYMSGGSYAGCEDPRMTQLGNHIYMTYVVFDGCNAPGVAMTSIRVEDFLKKDWKWKKPMMLSRPGEIQKNWMLFPEKINGKYAVLHSITPKIAIEYVDTLESDSILIESMKMPGVDAHRWDNIMRGAGAPPLKTKYGWLVLYHAMDRRDPDKYKVGAMILDYANPSRILYRCRHPILEPVTAYENHGAKPGVVYVCGAIIEGDTLFVYYGGADSVVCVATENINAFLEDLKHHTEEITQTKSVTQKINKPKYI